MAISNLRVGDKLRLRNGELIPADGRLLSGPACIDYSFVTGEAETVPKAPGDYLYAGGRQIGGAIEIETVKAVSQSQLTSLWNHEAFQKERESSLNTLTNRYSRWFTLVVIAVAVGAAVFWAGGRGCGAGAQGVHVGADRRVPVRAGAGGALRAGDGAAAAGPDAGLRQERPGDRTHGAGGCDCVRQDGHADGRSGGTGGVLQQSRKQKAEGRKGTAVPGRDAFHRVIL